MHVIDINGYAALNLGSTGNVVNTFGLGTITSIDVNGLVCSITGTGSNTATFSIPGYIDGNSYPSVGNLPGSDTVGISVVTVSDGTNTVTLRKRILPPADLIWANLETGFITTESGSILNSFSPSPSVNNQIYYDPTKCTVDGKGRYRSHVDTVNTLYHRDSSGVVRSFTVTVDSSDTTPDSFSFNTPSLAGPGDTVTSSNTTISGINAATAVSVTGGLVSINGGAFVSSGTITNGQTIAARVTASNNFSTAVTATVNVGGVTAQFTATTIAADTTPDLITFPASTNCVAGSAQASAVRSITGINASTPITAATNCTYSIAGGAATAADGSAVNNQSIQLFANASNTPGATVNASITIGGQVFTWAIITAQSQISFSAQGGAMSDPRLSIINKLASGILAALNAIGSSTVPVPVTANIKRGNYAYSSLGAPSISSKTANQVIYSNPFAPSGESIAIQIAKFLTGNLSIGANAFVFLECDLAGSTAYKSVHGTKRILSDANHGATTDGSYVFNFDNLKGGNWRLGINCGTVTTPNDAAATGSLGYNVTVMN